MQRSMILAFGLTAAVTAWMMTGTIVGAARSTQASAAVAPSVGETAPAEDEQRMRVLVKNLEAQSITREVVAQGQLEPMRQVTIRAETDGQVTELPADKGARVAAGESLVRVAPDDRPAQLARAVAEVATRSLELSAAEKLGKQGMQARTQIKAAQAALAAAEAELARLRIDLERLNIRAPFAGIVETRAVELGSLLRRGDAVLELVDNSTLKAVGFVPQQSAGALRIGQPVKVDLLDGTTAEGRLTYLAQVADPATRSFRVEAEIPNPDGRLASGVSAELRIAIGTARGHFLSPAVLALADDGEVGVRTVDASDAVQFHPVTLMRTEVDGVWVSGLPAQVRVIVQGQGFVTEGERVDPVPEQPSNT